MTIGMKERRAAPGMFLRVVLCFVGCASVFVAFSLVVPATERIMATNLFAPAALVFGLVVGGVLAIVAALSPRW